MISGDNLVNIMSPVLNKMKKEYDEKGSDIPNITYKDWLKLSQKEREENTYIIEGYPTGGGGGGGTPIDSEINYAFLHFNFDLTDRDVGITNAPVIFDVCESNNLEVENNSYIKLKKDSIYLINANTQNANYNNYLELVSDVNGELTHLIPYNGSDKSYQSTSLSGVIYKCTKENEKIYLTITNGYAEHGKFRPSMTSFSVLELAAFNYNSGPSFKKYSTEEQVIGTWIDGKPLYEKVIYLEQWDKTGWNKTGLTFDDNVYYFVQVQGDVIGDSSKYIGGNYYINNSDRFRTYIFEKDLYIHIGDNYPSVPCDIAIILKYTKKGDTING